MRATASPRDETPSLRYNEPTWVLTVCREMYKRSPISGMVRWVGRNGTSRSSAVVSDDAPVETERPPAHGGEFIGELKVLEVRVENALEGVLALGEIEQLDLAGLLTDFGKDRETVGLEPLHGEGVCITEELSSALGGEA